MSNSLSGSTGSSDAESDSPMDKEAVVKPTFFSEISMCEFAFGIGAVKLNCLCFGMMLNIPTLTLHKLMYSVAPKGLLDEETTDQDRIGVCKVILDHWMYMTGSLSDKKRFKQLYNAFIGLKEKSIAEELKKKFEANEPAQLEIFYKLDVGRLGPWVSTVPNEVDQEEESQGSGEDSSESGSDSGTSSGDSI